MMDEPFYPKIMTILNTQPSNSQAVIYSHVVKSILKEVLPLDHYSALLSEKSTDKQKIQEEIHQKLPQIAWSGLEEEAPLNISFYLCCLYRSNAYRFFYEMVSRWLAPGKRLNALLQFAVDFTFPEISDQVYIVGEVILRVESAHELSCIKKNLPIIESEIRLGIGSFYQASRILEIKGLSADEKTALIQENIASLVKHRPQDFDYDVFSEMQHFLVMCKDEFKAIREYRHMSRIICVHYLFRKTLRHTFEAFPERRFISVKLARARLHVHSQIKPVLGIIIGLSYLKDNEFFEERHVIQAVLNIIPSIKPIPGSFFLNASRSDPTRMLYIEIEKADGTIFTLNETEHLKNELPRELKKRIEQRVNTIFMPQNEEEIMRHILTLSNQIKFLRDIPQVIINFEKQQADSLEFLIILVRVLKPMMRTLQDNFENAVSLLEFVPDRTKIVGFVRKKYGKEANVFRIRIDKERFLRQDHSVDLYKARQVVADELHRVIGEFRDYNGGMISKQTEIFSSLRILLGPISKEKEFLLENFFYSLNPVIMRSVLEPLPLKTLFLMLVNAGNVGLSSYSSPLCRIHQEGEYLIILLIADDTPFFDTVLHGLEKMNAASTQLATSLVFYNEYACFGIIFRSPHLEEATKVRLIVEDALTQWTSPSFT